MIFHVFVRYYSNIVYTYFSKIVEDWIHFEKFVNSIINNNYG